MVYVALLLNVCLLVTGQIFFKWGLKAAGGFSLERILHIIFNPWILAGLVLYVVATVLWFYVLVKLPLSTAYPMQAISYILSLFVSRFLFHESIPWTRATGVAVILLGVALVAYQPRVHG